jgi:hypothetical protein
LIPAVCRYREGDICPLIKVPVATVSGHMRSCSFLTYLVCCVSLMKYMS